MQENLNQNTACNWHWPRHVHGQRSNESADSWPQRKDHGPGEKLGVCNTKDQTESGIVSFYYTCRMFETYIAMLLCSHMLNFHVLIRPHYELERIQLINYARNVTQDMDFIWTVECESNWDTEARSGTESGWYGLIQRNEKRYSETTNDPSFGDWKRQVQQAYSDYTKRISEWRIYSQIVWYSWKDECKGNFYDLNVWFAQWWKFNREFVQMQLFEDMQHMDQLFRAHRIPENWNVCGNVQQLADMFPTVSVK